MEKKSYQNNTVGKSVWNKGKTLVIFVTAEVVEESTKKEANLLSLSSCFYYDWEIQG